VEGIDTVEVIRGEERRHVVLAVQERERDERNCTRIEEEESTKDGEKGQIGLYMLQRIRL